MKGKLFLLLLPFALLSCSGGGKNEVVRKPVDTIGFATKQYQIDSVMSRILSLQGEMLSKAPLVKDCRLAVCPHDDYTYVGWLYPATLRNITAKTIILFGVAHKARRFGLEDALVFESFTHWHGPYGNIADSKLRDQIYSDMPQDMAIRHDSMHMVEHSIESMLPFLQHSKRDIEIVPILVPCMNFDRMREVATALATVLQKVFQKYDLSWGSDVALVVTTDAVHYGDEDWGGKNYAPFGADSAGYKKAVDLELEIFNSTLNGTLNQSKIHNFFSYTVDTQNYREYKWTWCGRYSIPFALLTAVELNKLMGGAELTGLPIGYATCIDHEPLPVSDLGMGKTAPANIRHWVGYAAVVYP
ncbi:MAG: AmmeMemoRadiSam system protein B [Bacteroidota bacterium]